MGLPIRETRIETLCVSYDFRFPSRRIPHSGRVTSIPNPLGGMFPSDSLLRFAVV